MSAPTPDYPRLWEQYVRLAGDRALTPQRVLPLARVKAQGILRDPLAAEGVANAVLFAYTTQVGSGELAPSRPDEPEQRRHRAWILRTTRNRALDLRRWRERRPALSLDSERKDGCPEPVAPRAGVGGDDEVRALRAVFQDLCRHLDPPLNGNEREILERRFVEGLNGRDLAESYGIDWEATRRPRGGGEEGSRSAHVREWNRRRRQLSRALAKLRRGARKLADAIPAGEEAPSTLLELLRRHGGTTSTRTG